jgi:hypothetical protein
MQRRYIAMITAVAMTIATTIKMTDITANTVAMIAVIIVVK